MGGQTVICAAPGLKVCRRCGELARHRQRSDDPGKPRSLCVGCTAEYLRNWRETNWQRRKAYDTWKGMLRRCYDSDQRRWANCPGIPQYRDYGAKGITVCNRWRESFDAFLEDVGLPPSRESTLDRRRCDRNYTPSNARWADQLAQASNRKNTRWTTATFPETGETLTLSVSEWARRTGVKRRTIGKRLDRGWSPDEAVGQLPAKKREESWELEEAPF